MFWCMWNDAAYILINKLKAMVLFQSKCMLHTPRLLVPNQSTALCGELELLQCTCATSVAWKMSIVGWCDGEIGLEMWTSLICNGFSLGSYTHVGHGYTNKNGCHHVQF